MRVPAALRPGLAGRRVLGLLLGAVLVAAVAVTVSWATHARSAPAAQSAVPASWQRPGGSAADLEKRSGVRLVRVAVSGGGGLLDVRFQVLDPDKAAALHQERTPPAVVDERTGLVLHDLLMNHVHNGAMKAAVTYYLVFENPGGWVQRGSVVTVLLGDAQVDHVVVA
ncbi:MAG: hypothetical protein AUI14_23325 [Actinobacteria bacterium 13_2_20CM_2_71_6]|nr:MAG: hypothetical protein AUI14_23325 [Actinobacteria bacterium 13_2_20CM_2_71_6]